ncbi:MAG: hypothetical protein AAFU57_18770 [Bacteroidota bacterium]
MQQIVLYWSLLCAFIILAYPLFLSARAKQKNNTSKPKGLPFLGDSVELYSFDLSERSNTWSFTLNIPEITEEVLKSHLVFCYLETEETCLKLPIHNASKGYTANVFQNIGKVYLTFKCLFDGVSNYNTPKCHVKSLKMILVKKKKYMKNRDILSHEALRDRLREIGVNLNNYEDTLGYLSNLAQVEFKGFRKNALALPKAPISREKTEQPALVF